jgi:GntR family transcriptional regulator
MPHFPFQRLQADLAAMIAKLPANSRLPSEPELAKQLGVSRATLREAMRMFETQGLIRRRQGAGTFIVGQVPVIDSGLEVLESLETMARRMGLTVSMGDAAIERIPADEENAAALGLPGGMPLVRVSRVMQADARPVAYLIDALPEDVLRPDELNGGRFSGSVLDYLIQRGDPLTVSQAAISACGASAEVAKMLEIQRGDVLLQITAKLFSGSGQVVDYSYSYFLPGYFKFHVVRRVGSV